MNTVQHYEGIVNAKMNIALMMEGHLTELRDADHTSSDMFLRMMERQVAELEIWQRFMREQLPKKL